MRFLIRLTLLLVLLLLTSLWLWNKFNDAADQPLALTSPIEFQIERGASLAQVANTLAREKIIESGWLFQLLAYSEKSAGKLKAGDYQLTPGITVRQLLALLVSGRVKQNSITFIEGWSFQQMLAELKRHPELDQQLAGLNQRQIMALISQPEEHPEGRFFPDTYFCSRGDSDRSILQRAYQKMSDELAKQWRDRASGSPLKTPYEALILASIIEKETGRADERSRIGGVFVRRLQQGMLLQTDPTVIYGMGKRFNGTIRRSDLKENTPYNTYLHSGLPPTPIAMPGRDSIHAALHPKKGSALYFVARGDGSHRFSDTLQAHNQAVDLYRKSRKKKQ